MFNIKKYEKYAFPIIRIALSFVFIWFGINQLINTDAFIGYLPNFLLTTSYASNIIIFNGIFEIVFGICLLVGFFVRPVALLLGLHMIGIIIGLGYNDIAVRDFGLMIVTFAISLRGMDKWTLDYRRLQS